MALTIPCKLSKSYDFCIQVVKSLKYATIARVQAIPKKTCD